MATAGTALKQSVTPGTSSRLRRFGRGINVAGIGFIALLLLLWESMDRIGLIDLTFLPRPSEILVASGELVRENQLFPNIAHTTIVTLVGWAIASVCGLVIGATLGLSKRIWTYTMSTIELFRALPSIVLLPIAVLLFGFSVRMELVLVIFAAQWPVMVSVIDGIRLVPDGLRDTGRTMRLSRSDILRKILLPAAIPQLLVGMRLALALSLILTVAAEMLANPEGMGYALVKEQESLHADRMFVYFLAIGILGILLNTIFVFLTRLLLPGHHARQGATQ